jgi:Holliday junction resolvase-like predicted endonuclease
VAAARPPLPERAPDIDLVMARGTEVAFVEVKTRRGLGFGDPALAVTGVSSASWRDRPRSGSTGTGLAT